MLFRTTPGLGIKYADTGWVGIGLGWYRIGATVSTFLNGWS